MALEYIVEPPPPGFDSWEQFAERIGLPPEDRDRLAAVVDPDRAKPRILFQKVSEAKMNFAALPGDIQPQHYAFLVTEELFDRIQSRFDAEDTLYTRTRVVRGRPTRAP